MKIVYNDIMEDILEAIEGANIARRGIKRIALGSDNIEELKSCLKRRGVEWVELPATLFGVKIVSMDQEAEILSEEGLAT